MPHRPTSSHHTAETFPSLTDHDSGSLQNDGTALGRVLEFARGLKRYGEIVVEETKSEVPSRTVLGVVGFDCAQLIDRCRCDSPDYDPTLCDFNTIASVTCIKGETWQDRNLMVTALSTIGSLQGWQVRKVKRKLCCSRMTRHDRDNTKEARPLASAPLEKSHCPFHISLKPHYRSRNPNTKSKSFNDCWDKPCEIVSCCLEHGGLCTPGPANLVSVRNRSGAYPKGTPIHALYLLCRYQERNMKLTQHNKS